MTTDSLGFTSAEAAHILEEAYGRGDRLMVRLLAARAARAAVPGLFQDAWLVTSLVTPTVYQLTSPAASAALDA